ncbi:MAG: PH domain-containing protein [Asgard group archaeon]|nr:PH domain-containing protein [Asgard group archaeon]
MLVPELALESEWVLKAITNDIRRKILYLIQDYSFLTYTDLLRELNLSTGKLNFHLRQLTGLIEKKDEKVYTLSPTGKRALDVINQLQSLNEETQEIIEFKSLLHNLSIQNFQPAVEVKKKWYIIIFSFFISTLTLWSVLSTVLDSRNNFLFQNLNKTSRILSEISIGIAILGFLLFLTILLARLYFSYLKYELLDTELTIGKGIITKTKTVIPFRTITNLLIKRGPLDRIFGISTLLIQTAGEGGTKNPEGKIIGIYYPHNLLEEVLNLVRLLDPPRYLREQIPISSTPASVSSLYKEILKELQEIKEKII